MRTLFDINCSFFFCLFVFWPHPAACGILVPQQGMEPVNPVLEAWSLNHWTLSSM